MSNTPNQNVSEAVKAIAELQQRVADLAIKFDAQQDALLSLVPGLEQRYQEILTSPATYKKRQYFDAEAQSTLEVAARLAKG